MIPKILGKLGFGNKNKESALAGISIDGNKNVVKQIFLSYSSEDKTSVEKICSLLESRGITCWMAPRDVRAGEDFGEQIINAIESTKIMVLVLSVNSNRSRFVKNEVERAFSKGKTVITLKIHEVEPSRALELFTATAHWIEAWNPPLESKVKLLGDTIIAIEKTKEEKQESSSNDKDTFVNSIGMKFTLIPEGTFTMGSNEYDNEKPVHKVTISKPFYLGVYPVIQREWNAVMKNNPSYFKGDNLPVESVSWNDVQEFIKRLNEKEGSDKYRLPSEPEWEYAARAGTTMRYSFGDDESKLGDYAWYRSNSNGETHEVGQKKPSVWGLYDMHGNVWEWVQDKRHDNYNVAPIDGSSWEGDGSYRVYRGGSWSSFARYCRSAFRYGIDPASRRDNLGFRLLRIS